jgi:hypothetical protein
MEKKQKPFEVIAARFQISNESAKYFLVQVQKSFKKTKPPEQLIINYLRGKTFKTLPKPHHIATLMSKSGIWVEELQPEPPALEDEKDIYF